MSKTAISWTDNNLNWLTWNCNKVSEGCKNCYAETLAIRRGQHFTGAPSWRASAVKDYQILKPGEVAFVNTMSDSFHEGVALEWIERMFMYARQKPKVQFLFLTKRIERALELSPRLDWSDNIWIGTSIENRKRLHRLETLKQMPTDNRFVSVEPLLEGLGEVDWRGVAGVIVGGESGANFRPFDKAWARTILTQCERDGATFFFKQGTAYHSGQDRMLDGRTWDDVPWRAPIEPKIEPVQMGLFGEPVDEARQVAAHADAEWWGQG